MIGRTCASRFALARALHSRPRMDVTTYWDRAARAEGSALTVSPFQTALGREAWIREQLQRWTLRLIRRRAPSRPLRAVDLGCGYGDFAARLAPMCADLTAVDFAPGFVEQARARLIATAHPSARAEQGDLRTYDRFGHVDLVHLGAVCMYLEDDELARVYRRIRERLRPDGIVVQREYAVVSLGRQYLRDRGEYKSWQRRAQKYTALARHAGLELVEKRYGPTIYLEELARRAPGWLGSALAWPARALGRLSLGFATHSSCTMVLRAR